jgi:phospholipid/cholesterol/gamma-HCH transport system permease protein
MPPVEPSVAAPVWQIQPEGARATLGVTGDWIALSGRIPEFPANALADIAAGQTLALGMAGIGRWDSGLIAFLWEARRAAEAKAIVIDDSALPQTARTLLGLLEDAAPAPSAAVPRRGTPVSWIGTMVLAGLDDLGATTQLLGATLRAGLLAPFGRTLVRGVDIAANLYDAGPAALPIAAVVTFLVGAILAFIGASQLSRFAASAYVADLVGLALVREMAPVMTAIVMAGRTGGAYAARIATMQGGEEIDALDVAGIPSVDYLVLPAVLSLMIMLPFLYLYGCLIGLFGGLLVATTMLGLTAQSYLAETRAALPLDQFIFGFGKCIAFGLLIGIASCQIGLRAGRSAADVGSAATQAVVIGIVGVIALDAVFAVLANGAGI